jgi:hypothetical protein
VGWQPDPVAPGEAPVFPGLALPARFALPGSEPWPAAEPPPPPCGPLDVLPPVRTLLLTWTMACLNGGMARTTLATNTTPASTAAGRIQATPLGVRGRGLVAAWAGTCPVPLPESSLSRVHGRALSRGHESGHAQ